MVSGPPTDRITTQWCGEVGMRDTSSGLVFPVRGRRPTGGNALRDWAVAWARVRKCSQSEEGGRATGPGLSPLPLGSGPTRRVSDKRGLPATTGFHRRWLVAMMVERSAEPR
jgi:hypothetical protein